MSNIYNNPWFHIPRPVSGPRLRLFCFPYAGGSASVYSNWCESLPPDIEVIAVQYPGRASRIAERPILTCEALVQALLPQMVSVATVPFALFGHSIGGLVSFELARILQERGSTLLRHQFISARRAPHLPQVQRRLHELPDSQLLQALKRLGGTPRELLAERDLMELLLPVLRADFSVGETFSYRAGTRLQCDVTLLYGRYDDGIPAEDVLRWSELIDGRIDSRSFDGGHFFINSNRREVLNFLSLKLAQSPPVSLARNTRRIASGN